VRPRYSFKRKPRGDGETFDVTDVQCPATAAGYRLFKQREIAADLKVRAPTAHRPPPTAHRPPPTAHRPPPTAHLHHP